MSKQTNIIAYLTNGHSLTGNVQITEANGKLYAQKTFVRNGETFKGGKFECLRWEILEQN